ncbi:IclR family transcriptional regulator [Sphingomonas naphthae]|uniref:IclR family transcriptional regulator n=1 Tax=Sphingomonas naphthae TaxID=1813468 RepID=A0ABY7TKQ1_9SPHN|nr:IclR family transcriptional regulator [Sphingomonas naphthae]WCT73790.1 IclR family transcriptional regulator [Sphingomonas naphthae]
MLEDVTLSRWGSPTLSRIDDRLDSRLRSTALCFTMQNDIDEDAGARESERHVAAVTAALAILDCFEEDATLRLRDLHERTGMQKSRIMRLAGSLAASGYLTVERGTGGYRLGPKVQRLAQIVAEGSAEIAETMRPILSRLALELGDTCFFSVVRGLERMVVEQASPEQALRFVLSEGQMRPLHVGATGKVLLAFGPEGLRQRVLSGALTPLTQATTVDAERLRREIGQARAQGYLVSRGEATAHSYALAVPVLDGAGVLMGALSIAGPGSRLPADQEIVVASALHRALAEAGLASSSIDQQETQA